MRVCGYCGWRELCPPLFAVPYFFARSCDWLRSASVSSFWLLRRGGDRGRSFPNRRKKLRQLWAKLIRPDNLAIHHEVLNQPLLRCHLAEQPGSQPGNKTLSRVLTNRDCSAAIAGRRKGHVRVAPDV